MKHPNLFLIGAPKSGTTFVHGILSKSPDIYTPTIKEPAYFLRRGRSTCFKERSSSQVPDLKNEKAYCDLFSNSTERYRIDASTHYLSSPETAILIREAQPDAKIIAILREPISRAYSHYLMGVRDGFIDEDLMGAIAQEMREMAQPECLWDEHYRIVRRSLYLDGLKSFHDQFSVDSFRVYLFQNLIEEPSFVIEDIGDFLGVPTSALMADLDRVSQNPYAKNRYPALAKFLTYYRRSSFRKGINKITPRSLRTLLRHQYRSLSLVADEKPPMPDEALSMLTDLIGSDYEESLSFATASGLLRTKSGSGNG